MSRLEFSSVGLLVFLALGAIARADDSWPQWQGPNRDGISPETGLLENWNTPPELLWKSAEVGIGYSGVVAAQGVVCTMGDRDGEMYACGLGAKDGSLLWKAHVGKAWTGNFPGPRSTPAIDGDRFFVLTPTGTLACGSVTTGKLSWMRQLQHDFGGQIPNWGYTESLLVDGDRLICTPGGDQAGMLALNKETGEEIWRCALAFEDKGGGKADCSSPVISQGGGIKQYIQMTTSGVVGVEAETGKQLWSHSQIQGENIPTPIVRGDHVFVTNSNVGSVLLKLVPKTGGIEAQEVYFLEKLKMRLGSIVLVEDHLYSCQSNPQCIEFLTGKSVWNKRGPGANSAIISYAEGNLYLFHQNGMMVLIAANPDEFEVKGKFQVKGLQNQCLSRPAISDGKLYVRDQGVLCCYNLRK